MSNRFLIDKITNSIEASKDGKSHLTEVLAVSEQEIKGVHKKDGWLFNWKQEFKKADRSVYKLVIMGETQIQGLICLQPMENFIEMHLIETAPHNFGQAKRYLGVAGNLVAFACRMSFEMGFDGFVAFTAKTDLIDHYTESLEAELIFNNRMTISTNPAKNLVNSYYKDYFNGR